MGTIAQKLEAVNNSKKAIKTAIEAKGVVVGNSPLSDYANKINTIATGGEFDKIVTENKFELYANNYIELLKYTADTMQGISEIYNGQFAKDRKILTIPDNSTLKPNTINLSGCWISCTSLSVLDLSNWDVSKVTNISNIFNTCISLNRLDLSRWDTSVLTNMEAAWRGCSNIEYLNLSGLDVSNVSTIWYCWFGCNSLKYLDLTGWDIGNCTNITNIFNACSLLRDLKCFRNAKISFSLDASPLLTRESLLSILQAPTQVTTAQTIKLHADTKKLITTAQNNVSAGTADELDTQIATEVNNVINKGWTIA